MFSAIVATVGVGELGTASQEAALNCSLENIAVLFSGVIVNFWLMGYSGHFLVGGGYTVRCRVCLDLSVNPSL